MKIPIWYKDEAGKYHLIPAKVREQLKPGTILQHNPTTGYWRVFNDGYTEYFEGDRRIVGYFRTEKDHHRWPTG